jgi:hypothetical protein
MRQHFYKSIVFLVALFLLHETSVAQIPQAKTVKSRPQIVKKTELKYEITAADDLLLEDLSKRSFQFFWEQSDANTGLTLDRSRADGTSLPTNHPSNNIASSASTGFALTSYCIAAERNWLSRDEIKLRTRKTLDFLANRAFHKNGWFYHWMDRVSGERRWKSEISSIDTALLLGGVLSAKQCFADDKEIVRLAKTIYERVDFPWMLDNGEFLSHGWLPETGFIPYRWSTYSENSILYLLAIGSPTHPISPKIWYRWKRERVNFAGFKYISAQAPIFIHQYTQAWFDFRNKRERTNGFSVNYFENSVKATRAHKACNLSLSKRFIGYSENIWGISAMDAEQGYVVWNCPPADSGIDGTVAPYVAAASMMFTPDIAMPALNEMKQRFGDTIYKKYGFADGFNPTTGWVGTDVIGIDTGIQLLGIENYRTGKVWQWFMQNQESQNALIRAKIR